MLHSCEQENIESLPPATQIGANTFGCLIDGKVFVPNSESTLSDCIPARTIEPIRIPFLNDLFFAKRLHNQNKSL